MSIHIRILNGEHLASKGSYDRATIIDRNIFLNFQDFSAAARAQRLFLASDPSLVVLLLETFLDSVKPFARSATQYH